MGQAPDFVIAGATKSGTTSAYWYLAQHEQIYFPIIKEPRFFAFCDRPSAYTGPDDELWRSELVSSPAQYRAMFADARADQLTAEASGDYLYLDWSARAMNEWNPAVRTVFMLRDPAERAFSNWAHMVRDGFETLDFPAALAAEEQRIEDGYSPRWHYVQRGYYARHLQRFVDELGPDRIHVELFETFVADAAAGCDRIVRFLQLPAWPFDCSAAHNQGVEPRNRTAAGVYRFARSERVRRLVPQRARALLKARFDRVGSMRRTPPRDVLAELGQRYAPDQELLHRLMREIESAAARN